MLNLVTRFWYKFKPDNQHIEAFKPTNNSVVDGTHSELVVIFTGRSSCKTQMQWAVAYLSGDGLDIEGYFPSFEQAFELFKHL